MEPLFLTFDTLLEERYLIQGIVGEGGFAVVYEALDEKLGQQVAIKALTYGGLSQDAVARFEQEARLVASLHHADIVRVMDYGLTPQGAPFFVMEMLQGYTLEQALWQHGAMTPERALGLLKRCLHALDTAHASGVVHRDLKPANLFLVHPHTSAESLTILDLGLGYLIEQEAGRLTGDLTLLGTAGYLAPEYATQRIVTPAMDVYQMGLVLLSMLTGGEPDKEDHARWIERGLALVPMPAREVVARALDADHTTRYAHAGEMLAALEAAHALQKRGADITSTAQGAGEHLVAPSKKTRLVYVVPLCVALLLVLGAWAMYMNVENSERVDTITHTHQTSHPEHVEEVQREPKSARSFVQAGAVDAAPDSMDLAGEDAPDMTLDTTIANTPDEVPRVEPARRPPSNERRDDSPPTRDVLDPELSKELEWLERNR